MRNRFFLVIIIVGTQPSRGYRYCLKGAGTHKLGRNIDFGAEGEAWKMCLESPAFHQTREVLASMDEPGVVKVPGHVGLELKPTQTSHWICMVHTSPPWRQQQGQRPDRSQKVSQHISVLLSQKKSLKPPTK